MKLIGEFVSGPPASAAFRIPALNHEVRNHAMKNRAVIERLSGLGAFRQADKVVHCFGSLVGKQFDFELAFSGVERRVDLVGHDCDCSNSEGPHSRGSP